MAKTDDRLRFVDTNILLAATDESRTHHDKSLALLEKGLSGEKSLFFSGQVLREYLVVGTRPVEANGLGLTPAEALANIREFNRCGMVLDETRTVASQLQKLVEKHQLSGKRIHDANIVAVMLVNGMKTVATDNEEDFSGFPEVHIEW